MGHSLNRATLEELQLLQREIGKAIASFEARRKAAALADIETMLKARGMTVRDIAGLRIASKGSLSAPRYVHPDNPAKTWTGRGRRPDWIKAALTDGQTLEAFQIP